MSSEKISQILKDLSQNLRDLQKNKTRDNLKDRLAIIELLKSDSIDEARKLARKLIVKDYYIECLDLIEGYSDLLNFRIDSWKNSKNLVDGISECQASIIWASKYIAADVSEVNLASGVLKEKLDEKTLDQVMKEHVSVNENMVRWLTVKEAEVPDALVEKYLMEIADIFEEAKYSGNAKLVEKDAELLNKNWKRDDERVLAKAGIPRKSLVHSKSVEDAFEELYKRVEALQDKTQ